MDAQIFWNNVNSLIKSQKTTQEWLCAHCQINFGTFKNRSSKKIVPDAIEAVRIAKALNTTVEYLVTGISSNPAETELAQFKEKVKNLYESI